MSSTFLSSLLLKKIDQLSERKKKIQESIELLDELPQKLEHNILSSINSVCLVPTTLYHTNEILVSFGEDFFVERTSMQTKEILKRRLKVLEDQIIKQENIRKELEDNNIVSESDEIIEIKEKLEENNLTNKSIKSSINEEEKPNNVKFEESNDYKVLRKYREEEEKEEKQKEEEKTTRPVSKFKRDRMNKQQ